MTEDLHILEIGNKVEPIKTCLSYFSPGLKCFYSYETCNGKSGISPHLTALYNISPTNATPKYYPWIKHNTNMQKMRFSRTFVLKKLEELKRHWVFFFSDIFILFVFKLFLKI